MEISATEQQYHNVLDPTYENVQRATWRTRQKGGELDSSADIAICLIIINLALDNGHQTAFFCQKI